jgi:PPOX class probable F420-dependent enzyme
MQLSEQVKKFLEEPHFAVVATIRADGTPHQTVTWYESQGDELLLNTPYDSVKHKHLRRDPRLSVCIEAGYQYITLTGTASLNEDPKAARADYERLGQRYRGSFTQRPTAGTLDPQLQQLLTRERVAIHMKIEHVQANGLE